MPTLRRTALISIALAAAASAQTASITFFGSASGETSAGQRLAATGLPQIGSTFSIQVSYATPPFTCLTVVTSWEVWLVLGFSNTSWIGLPLPLSMPQGFDLLVSADTVLPTVVGSPSSCPPGSTSGAGPSFPLTIPNQAGLIGLQFHQQILMSRILGVGVALPPMATNAGTATIGL